MRILLDENLPESLLSALQERGHSVASVNSLNLKGLDNGSLWNQFGRDYDLLFTKDAGFAHNVARGAQTGFAKLVRVALSQSTARIFVPEFIALFERTDWESFESGDDWP